MITYTGRSVWPHTDEGDRAPSLFDIGVGLGRMVRFNGQTERFYTVLAHTLTVALLMPPEHAIFGLMHDAPESCMADVPTPWKTEEAKALELHLLERINGEYGLPWPIPHDAQEAVELADRQALAAEAHVLGHPQAEQIWPDPDPKAIEVTEFHIEKVPSLLIPDTAGPLFEAAFTEYHAQWKAASQAVAAS